MLKFAYFGLYFMYFFTVIQLNLYTFWMYCFDNSIIVHLIRNLIHKVRVRVCNHKIEPNYPYMCVYSNQNELYIPIDQVDSKSTFNFVANGVNNTGNEYLLIMRCDDGIISRIFSDNKEDYEVGFVKSRKYLLSIEYTHPDMKERIVIELDPAIYLVGNEILSSCFVLRHLQHQSENYIFDDRYVLDIMDSKIKMLTLKASEYILIGNTEYEKKGLKI